MAVQLSSTITWAIAFIRNQPVTANTGNEPAITSANITKQTILGPPFIWSWNRVTNSATSTVAGTQDYTVSLADFGFLEKATVTDPLGTVTELEWKQALSAEAGGLTNRARPTYLSTQTDDGAGNIGFRLMPVPDAVYTLTVIYQKQPVPFATTTDTWAPIPDRFSYIYSRGFLAFAMEAAQDARFSVEHTRFMATLVSASEGLSEMQKNIFLGNAITTSSQTGAAGLRTQQATQARSI
jgi:hypothetical protein